MIKADNRDMPFAPDLQRSPGKLVGVADLDAIRLHLAQDIGAGLDRTRHAMAAGKRNRDTGHADDCAVAMRIGEIGRNDTVLNLRVPFHPVRLGLQVGFHTTAFGRIEQGNVYQVHFIFLALLVRHGSACGAPWSYVFFYAAWAI